MITAYPDLSAAQRALNANRYQEAAQIALRHVRAHPGEPRGLGLLGTVAMKMGALGQAEQFLRQALQLAPESPQIMQELASCLHQQERPGDAQELFGLLDKTNPGDPQTGLTIGVLLDKLGRTEEARERFEVLAKQNPNNINVWLAYAHNLRSTGRTDESVEAYRRATKIDSGRGDAWWGLASIRKKIFTDEDIEEMEQAASIAVDVANLAPLQLAIARARHERGEFEAAFNRYSEGNRVRAESIGYDARELTEEVSRSEQMFGREFFARPADGGDPSSAPIFIVSLPRSGSTLVEQMLGSHPDVEPLGELPYIPALMRSAMETAMRRGVTSVPEVISLLSPADRTAFGREYLRRATLHRKSGVARFTDKLPHNWSNIIFIRQILPNARFIDIRRNALDCCFSNFTQSFSRAHASSFALTDIGQCYVDYVRYMGHLDDAAPGMAHHVSYERLIDHPEAELRSIIDYLGLEWNDAPLNFHQNDRVVRTPSAEQVRRPLNREGVDVWKPYAQWLGPLRKVLGPLADA
jgi:cytochrome c-type biogenesis protein CcmH/NrfG